jgi:hypothetical protein
MGIDPHLTLNGGMNSARVPPGFDSAATPCSGLADGRHRSRYVRSVSDPCTAVNGRGLADPNAGAVEGRLLPFGSGQNDIRGEQDVERAAVNCPLASLVGVVPGAGMSANCPLLWFRGVVPGAGMSANCPLLWFRGAVPGAATSANALHCGCVVWFPVQQRQQTALHCGSGVWFRCRNVSKLTSTVVPGQRKTAGRPHLRSGGGLEARRAC